LLFVEPFFLFVILPTGAVAFYLTSYFLGIRIASIQLIFVSVIFYVPYGVIQLSILISSLLFNAICGFLLIENHVKTESKRRNIFTFAMLSNFILLFTFKYLYEINKFTLGWSLPWLDLSIPAGISFYTFHQAVFIYDAYNRQPETVGFFKNSAGLIGRLEVMVRYSNFVAFFPQLIIGPITYLREYAPQVFRQDFGKFKTVDCQIGVTLIIVGLFKKLCIADSLALAVDPVYAALQVGTKVSSAQAIYALLGYYFQLYFDFSGYSDIALGIARLFGIRLPINFDSPLRATGIGDFYRRWHITLTRVIALFLFTPIAFWGARVASGKEYKGWRYRALASWLPLLVNFQVIAIWHAAKATFMMFGLLHGIWYILEAEIKASRAFKTFKSRTTDRFRTVAGMAVTAVPLMLTFAIFRSDSLEVFWRLLDGLASPLTPRAPTAPIKMLNWQVLCFAAAIVYFMPNAYELMRRYRPGIVTFTNKSMTPSPFCMVWRPTLIWALGLIILCCFIFVRLNRPTPFLYAGF
jgi:alginate O-acetyltransferase complex protein AlgI